MNLFDAHNYEVTSAGCWEWRHAKSAGGYGVVRVDGKARRAHRLSVEIATGVPIAASDVVCHRCDNPSCINPDHLFIADQRTNLRDMRSKGRDSGFAAQHRAQTHCKRNHEFTPSNTRHYRGSRVCLTCKAERNAARDRNKEKTA